MVGLPTNDIPNIHPNTLQRYYETPDVVLEMDALELQETVSDLQQRISDDQASSIRHAAIKAPKTTNPFITVELEALFMESLTELEALEHIPHGYGLTVEERNGEPYPVSETIRSGKKGTREIEVLLSTEIWWKRALLWARGHELLSRAIV